MPLIALGIGSAIAGIGGGAIAARGAGKAADTQADAATQAAQIQAQSQKEALAFQREQLGESTREYNQNQANLKPWMDSGTGALSRLQELMGPNGELSQKFQAPTAATEQNDPGYQFRLDQGMKALQASAAARGSLLSGGTLKSLQQYGQDYASNEYSNVYNRSFNEFQTGQANTFNRLSALAGTGQTAAGQIASMPSPYAGSQIPGTIMQGGENAANAAQAAGAARASGYASGGNIWGQGINNIGQMPLNFFALQQLSRGGAGYGQNGGVH